MVLLWHRLKNILSTFIFKSAPPRKKVKVGWEDTMLCGVHYEVLVVIIIIIVKSIYLEHV